MATIRTFIAIAPTEEVRQKIGQMIEDLKPHAQGIRWVKAENLHLTLRFLGDVEESRMPEVHQAVVSAAGQPFSIRPGALGAFPNVHRPRVLYVSLEGGLEALLGLQHRVEDELVGRGFPREDRPFAPHLTIGRAMRDRRGAINLPSISDPAVSDTVVREVLVMKSDLRPDGPIYTPMARVGLKE
ncbi:MAG: RNA 2',3'-cyclic phosphodiesterase [Candidatus Latescibacteria bacterium]|nr:RNA 2',3'-cyclic phosphodiesterase [Candidatus Latescibacterota bacterium]